MQPADLSSQTPSGAARRIAIIGSGTAGHVSPALAIADAYQKTSANVDVLFLGNARCFEARLLPTLGHRLALIQGAPLYGVGMVGKLRAMLMSCRRDLPSPPHLALLRRTVGDQSRWLHVSERRIGGAQSRAAYGHS